MSVKIDLADSTFRAYRRRDGDISLHLRGYLLVHTDAGFRLGAYLKAIKCWIKLPGRKEEEFDSVGFSECTVCKYDQSIMLHDLWISTVIRPTCIGPCVADFRMMYHISFTGHRTEEPEFIYRKVPVIPRF